MKRSFRWCIKIKGYFWGWFWQKSIGYNYIGWGKYQIWVRSKIASWTYHLKELTLSFQKIRKSLKSDHQNSKYDLSSFMLLQLHSLITSFTYSLLTCASYSGVTTVTLLRGWGLPKPSLSSETTRILKRLSKRGRWGSLNYIVVICRRRLARKPVLSAPVSYS